MQILLHCVVACSVMYALYTYMYKEIYFRHRASPLKTKFCQFKIWTDCLFIFSQIYEENSSRTLNIFLLKSNFYFLVNQVDSILPGVFVTYIYQHMFMNVALGIKLMWMGLV